MLPEQTMQTMRLRSIHSPAIVLGMLESFAICEMTLPAEARRLFRLSELPDQLRRRVGGGPDQQYVWLAWSASDRTFLLTGALAVERSRERGTPVLDVRIYNPDGQLEEAATWLRTGGNQWERCNW
jgi:hypothetical protein